VLGLQVCALEARATEPIHPEVRRDAHQVRARPGEVRVRLPELAEDPDEHVLQQVLAVPQVAGQAAGVAKKIRPQGRDLVDEPPHGPRTSAWTGNPS
jgi:hypothetical protein